MSKTPKKKKSSNRVNQVVSQKTETDLENKVYTIRLDEDQKQQLLDELTERIEWSTNRIIDEAAKPSVFVSQRSKNDMFSIILRVVLSILFSGFGTLLIIGIVINWGSYWTGGIQNLAVMCVFLIGLVCLSIGIDIFREKDRDYLVSLFSVLVALVALILAVLK